MPSKISISFIWRKEFATFLTRFPSAELNGLLNLSLSLKRYTNTIWHIIYKQCSPYVNNTLFMPCQGQAVCNLRAPTWWQYESTRGGGWNPPVLSRSKCCWQILEQQLFGPSQIQQSNTSYVTISQYSAGSQWEPTSHHQARPGPHWLLSTHKQTLQKYW